jgi:excisionase family DNA binding protein
VARRRVEITFERERLLFVGRRTVSITEWCRDCGARVRMVMPDEAARLTGATARTVYQLVEAGRLHFSEGQGAGLLVCLESLKELSQDSPDRVSTEEKKGADR